LVPDGHPQRMWVASHGQRPYRDDGRIAGRGRVRRSAGRRGNRVPSGIDWRACRRDRRRRAHDCKTSPRRSERARRGGGRASPARHRRGGLGNHPLKGVGKHIGGRQNAQDERQRQDPGPPPASRRAGAGEPGQGWSRAGLSRRNGDAPVGQSGQERRRRDGYAMRQQRRSPGRRSRGARPLPGLRDGLRCVGLRRPAGRDCRFGVAPSHSNTMPRPRRGVGLKSLARELTIAGYRSDQCRTLRATSSSFLVRSRQLFAILRHWPVSAGDLSEEWRDGGQRR
jgi:hypothetical protein